MTGLRTLTSLDPNRHNPAVGIYYGRESLIGRVLIVGMLHYGGAYVRSASFTHDIIGELIKSERRIPYFTKVAGLFRNGEERPYAPQDFYSRVALYNFSPDEFVVRQRVKRDQWLNADAQRFFLRVLDHVKPKRVLITGEQLRRALPPRLPGALGKKRVREDGPGLYVPFRGEDREVGAITHPSTKKFNQNRSAIARSIQQFMTLDKRVPSTASSTNR
jgi:hypothetical protein